MYVLWWAVARINQLYPLNGQPHSIFLLWFIFLAPYIYWSCRKVFFYFFRFKYRITEIVTEDRSIVLSASRMPLCCRPFVGIGWAISSFEGNLKPTNPSANFTLYHPITSRPLWLSDIDEIFTVPRRHRQIQRHALCPNCWGTRILRSL